MSLGEAIYGPGGWRSSMRPCAAKGCPLAAARPVRTREAGTLDVCAEHEKVLREAGEIVDDWKPRVARAPELVEDRPVRPKRTPTSSNTPDATPIATPSAAAPPAAPPVAPTEPDMPHVPLAVDPAAPAGMCRILGCSNPAETRGLCRSGYQLWHRSGKPEGIALPVTPPGEWRRPKHEEPPVEAPAAAPVDTPAVEPVPAAEEVAPPAEAPEKPVDFDARPKGGRPLPTVDERDVRIRQLEVALDEERAGRREAERLLETAKQRADDERARLCDLLCTDGEPADALEGLAGVLMDAGLLLPACNRGATCKSLHLNDRIHRLADDRDNLRAQLHETERLLEAHLKAEDDTERARRDEFRREVLSALHEPDECTDSEVVALARAYFEVVDGARELLGLSADVDLGEIVDALVAVTRAGKDREIQIWQAIGEPEGLWPWERLVEQVERLGVRDEAGPRLTEQELLARWRTYERGKQVVAEGQALIERALGGGA